MIAASRGARVRAQLLSRRDREAALAYLARHPRENLLLTDMVSALGATPPPNEPAPAVVVAWRGDAIEGVASIRPSMVLDYAISDAGLEACLPLLGQVESGLIKSPLCSVSRLWQHLRTRGRQPLIDRRETAFRLVAPPPGARALPELPAGARLRCAGEQDLDDLVDAARASLREESRPDPFDGDPIGFRRWVRGRLARARLVDIDGRPVFVGYADVRLAQGWLIQGVYTFPEYRRRGYARAGMAGLVREAFAAAAEHVQLAVVDGNDPAIALYSGLGFEPFCELRTILFL